MAIVTYKCDTCKRTKEIIRNIYGLETPSRCVVTHGCRGKMYHQDIKQDYVRGRTPPDVVGLDNWQQRRILKDYEQAIERDEWTIVHNLGNSVNISVFVNQPTSDDPDNQEEIIPDDIIIISPDAIKLVFSRPYSGKAQLIARASDPHLLNPVVAAQEEVAPALQISNSGEITLATRISTTGEAADMNVQLTYSTPQETVQVIEYVADDQPAIESPWVDYNKVVIKGNIYLIRSFNGIVPEMASGVIGNGSTFRFTGIDGNPPNTNDVFLLLASSPFTVVDKITNNIVDITNISETVNPFTLAYDTGEFFVDPVTFQSVYPPVRSV